MEIDKVKIIQMNLIFSHTVVCINKNLNTLQFKLRKLRRRNQNKISVKSLEPQALTTPFTSTSPLIFYNNLSSSQFLWVLIFVFFALIVKCHKPTLIAEKFQLSLDNMQMLKLVAKHTMSVMKMEEVAKKDQNSFAQMEQSTTKR